MPSCSTEIDTRALDDPGRSCQELRHGSRARTIRGRTLIEDSTTVLTVSMIKDVTVESERLVISRGSLSLCSYC